MKEDLTNQKRQLIKTMYLGKKKNGSGNDVLILVHKLENNEKLIIYKENPLFSYHVTKKEYWNEVRDSNKYIEVEKTNLVETPYDKLFNSFVPALDNDKEFKRRMDTIYNSGSNIWNQLKELHLDNRLHGSDMNIEDYYIQKFHKHWPYETNYMGLSRSFFDIEVDTSEYEGFPDPEKADCEVNIISLAFKESREVYSFILKYDTDTFREAMDNIDILKKEMVDEYNDYKPGIGDALKFIMYQYDTEIELIQGFFDTVNSIKPDFISAWNTKFDFRTLYNRIIKLGYEPPEVMCPKEVPKKYKYCDYRIDNYNRDLADKSDNYFVTGYTNYTDSMNLYAALTKMKGRLESYALDNVAEKELGIKKDDTGDGLRNLHLVDYSKFLRYNIKDSMLLMLLEDEEDQIESFYLLSLLTSTRVNKALKKSICLRNYSDMYHQSKGLVLSNNRSALFPKTGKFKGAFVGDPNNIDHIGLNVFDLNIEDSSKKLNNINLGLE